MIYKRTGNLREVQLLLGHTKIESTVRYLGIEIDDALENADRLTSELPGQSGHPLPIIPLQVWAISGPLLKSGDFVITA